MNRPANDANGFYADLTSWEYAWTAGHEPYAGVPQGDSVGTAQDLFAKWGPVMREVYPRFDWLHLEPMEGAAVSATGVN